MSVHKRKGKHKAAYFYDFMIKGVRYRDTIPEEEARTKAQAEDFEARKRVEILEGRSQKPSRTFGQYAKEVFLPWSKGNKKSWKTDAFHVEVLVDYFGHKRFSEISPMSIEKFMRERCQIPTQHGHPRKPASVNREIACLSRIFSLAQRDRLTGSNPCLQVKKLRENNKRVRYALPEEERKLAELYTGQRAHLAPIVTIALNSGMRRGEILSLRWDQVDFSRGVIHLPDPKSGRDESVVMNEKVMAELLRLHQSAGQSEYVFPNPKTGRPYGSIRKAWIGACRDAGIENLNIHDLRHTAATRLADTGADPVTIAAILRHSDLRMTARYTHALDHRNRRALARIASYGSESDCQKFAKNE